MRPVGATQPIPVDVRVISATHRDLEAQTAAGQFREDLYYRLNVVSLKLPPLAERREDIPLLADALPAPARRALQASRCPRSRPTRWRCWSPRRGPATSASSSTCSSRRSRSPRRAVIPASLVAEASLREDASALVPFEEARKTFERDYLVRLLKITERQRDAGGAARQAQPHRVLQAPAAPSARARDVQGRQGVLTLDRVRHDVRLVASEATSRIAQ